MRSLILILILCLSACSKPEKTNHKTCPLHGYDNEHLLKGTLSYKAPALWQAIDPTNPMRLAEYIVDPEYKINLAVYSLPPQSVNANVSRWKEQFVDDDQRELLEKKQFNFDKIPITIYHIKGNYRELSDPMNPKSEVTIRSNYALLAAIVELKSGTWFFKMLGADDRITLQRNNFNKLVYSFEVIK